MKITFIHHSSFLVELEGIYLLFDYTQGRLPALKEDKWLLVLASHRHADHYSPRIFDLGEGHGKTRYLLSHDIWRKNLPEAVKDRVDSIKPGQSLALSLGGEKVEVTTFRSTDEGVAFLVSCQGQVIYHAGDLNNWIWKEESDQWNRDMEKKYKEEIQKLEGRLVDVAFLPLDPRQEEDFYLGMDQYMATVGPRHVFPMHCWGDFSVIGRIKAMDCSAGYRERIVDVNRDGEEFWVG